MAALSGGFRQLPLWYISRMGKKGFEREETLLLDHLVWNTWCTVAQVCSGPLVRCVLIVRNFLGKCCRSATAAPNIFHLLRTSGCCSASQEHHVPFGSLALWNYQGRWSVSLIPVLCESYRKMLSVGLLPLFWRLMRPVLKWLLQLDGESLPWKLVLPSTMTFGNDVLLSWNLHCAG